jgi:hypothetical protein
MAVTSVVITAVAGAPTNEICTRAFCTAIAATPTMPAKTAVGEAGSSPKPAETQIATTLVSRIKCNAKSGLREPWWDSSRPAAANLVKASTI